MVDKGLSDEEAASLLAQLLQSDSCESTLVAIANAARHLRADSRGNILDAVGPVREPDEHRHPAHRVMAKLSPPKAPPAMPPRTAAPTSQHKSKHLHTNFSAVLWSGVWVMAALLVICALLLAGGLSM